MAGVWRSGRLLRLLPVAYGHESRDNTRGGKNQNCYKKLAYVSSIRQKTEHVESN